jgi:hypothetical protein
LLVRGGYAEYVERRRPLLLHEARPSATLGIVVAAGAAHNGDGFSADDVAWLLDRAPGEIVILRTPASP